MDSVVQKALQNIKEFKEELKTLVLSLPTKNRIQNVVLQSELEKLQKGKLKFTQEIQNKTPFEQEQSIEILLTIAKYQEEAEEAEKEGTSCT